MRFVHHLGWGIFVILVEPHPLFLGKKVGTITTKGSYEFFGALSFPNTLVSS